MIYEYELTIVELVKANFILNEICKKGWEPVSVAYAPPIITINKGILAPGEPKTTKTERVMFMCRRPKIGGNSGS